MLGDYFPLTPRSLDTPSWIAWQFQRSDHVQGLVRVFRRPDAIRETLVVKLQGLEPQRIYEGENLKGATEVRTEGELMRGFAITLREKPAAAVFPPKGL